MPHRYGLGRTGCRQRHSRHSARTWRGVSVGIHRHRQADCHPHRHTQPQHPQLPSVCDIWKAADFLEREVFDFYGVVFVGHPDIRRLYLRNDWVGHPMRKDDDPEAQNPLRMDNEETIDTTTELELNPDGTVKNKETQLFGDDEYVVNIGPQHPATHGVMRFRVSLEGEIIKKIDANCGYIHRGIEKRCPKALHTRRHWR